MGKIRTARVVRVLLASACAATVMLAPTAARANPPSWALTLNCRSGTGQTVLSGYTPRISTGGASFNSNGSLWCDMVRTGQPTHGSLPMAVNAVAQMNAVGSFNKVVDGTGAALGVIQVYFAGARFDLPFSAAFAGGQAPIIIAGGSDTDGDVNGYGGGAFSEVVCSVPGCVAAGPSTVAFSVEFAQIPPA